MKARGLLQDLRETIDSGTNLCVIVGEHGAGAFSATERATAENQGHSRSFAGIGCRGLR